MKKYLFTLTALLASGLTLAQEVDNVIDEVIWVVGDEAILRSEVEQERKRMLYQGEKIEKERFTGFSYAVEEKKLLKQDTNPFLK